LVIKVRREEVIHVEDWAEIRRLHRAEQMPIRAIARHLGISKNTVKRALAHDRPHWHVVPLPYWEWITGEPAGARKPDSSGALVTARVIPQREAAHRPDEDMPFRAEWAFPYEGSDEICGLALERALREKTLPRMRHLLDRSNLLEVVRSTDVSLRTRMDPLAGEIVLRVDSDPPEEVGALIDQEEAAGGFPRFVHWARQRLAERIPN
jgi:hypothetical protein